MIQIPVFQMVLGLVLEFLFGSFLVWVLEVFLCFRLMSLKNLDPRSDSLGCAAAICQPDSCPIKDCSEKHQVLIRSIG